MDTHALSEAAHATAIEVFAANGVELMIQAGLGYTPTPAISHAILTYNRGRAAGLADGVVITPSHNPPSDGGFKYNPPSGGPADTQTTGIIQDRANQILAEGLKSVKRMPYEQALNADTTHQHDYVSAYVNDLRNVIDLAAIAQAGIKIGVDPMGGASLNYWDPIAETYHLQVEVVNRAVDPTFSFMTVDYDGKIRMDSSSPFAMARLIELKDRFQHVRVSDTGKVFNMDLMNAWELGNLLDLAELTTVSALNRTESRGGHSREDYSHRDDKNWLKHTLAWATPEGKIDIKYKPVVITKYQPKERVY
jgi:phosphoglucomutase